MRIDEKEITSSSVPDGQYERKAITENSEMEINDTSEETKSAQRTLKLTISKDVKSGGRFTIDIEKEEEKKFFSDLNQKLKQIS